MGCHQAGQADKACMVWQTVAKIQMWGGPAYQLHHTAENPPSATCLQWWKQSLDGDTHPVPDTTAQNTILGLEKHTLWQHGTPEKTESDNRTHFKNSLTDSWARGHRTEWVYPISYHMPASEETEQYNRLLESHWKQCVMGPSNTRIYI